MKKLRNIIDRLPFDNKLIVTLVTFVLAYLATKLGLGLDTEIIPPYNVGMLISVAAAAIAGYFYPNEATILRNADNEDGNPSLVQAKEHGVIDG